LPHRFGQAQPAGRLSSDIAGGDRASRVETTHRPHGGGEHAGSRTAGRRRQPWYPDPEEIPGIAEVHQECQPPGRDVVTPDRTCLVREGRTSDVLEEGDENHVPDLVRVAAGRPGQPGRDNTPAERFIARRTHTQISDGGEPTEQPEQAEHAPQWHLTGPVR